MPTVDLLNDKCGHSKPVGRVLGCADMLLDMVEEGRR